MSTPRRFRQIITLAVEFDPRRCPTPESWDYAELKEKLGVRIKLLASGRPEVVPVALPARAADTVHGVAEQLRGLCSAESVGNDDLVDLADSLDGVVFAEAFEDAVAAPEVLRISEG